MAGNPRSLSVLLAVFYKWDAGVCMYMGSLIKVGATGASSLTCVAKKGVPISGTYLPTCSGYQRIPSLLGFLRYPSESAGS